jgi:TolB protein
MGRLALLALLLAAAAIVAVTRLLPPWPPELKDVVQLTSGGTHAEAYWSPDGSRLVLMALRPGDPADQIYELDPKTKSLRRLSTGKGKTTCGYALGGGRTVFSSTHHKGDAPPPAPDRSRGYAWPFFREFDLFLRAPDGSLKQLTDVDGYDAETTPSPDGQRLVFTSHREGGMGLWTMKVDGTDLKRITTRRGYVGGAFFSPDGASLVYRAFYPRNPEEDAVYQRLLDNRVLEPNKCHFEIYVSKADGSGERQLTSNGKANWAPSFHPDGRTIVFASNMDAGSPGRFSLYAIGVDGQGLRRLTWHEGFDSFPHFSPDGAKLVFISNRNGADPRRDLNVFMADWR